LASLFLKIGSIIRNTPVSRMGSRVIARISCKKGTDTGIFFLIPAYAVFHRVSDTRVLLSVV